VPIINTRTSQQKY